MYLMEKKSLQVARDALLPNHKLAQRMHLFQDSELALSLAPPPAIGPAPRGARHAPAA